MQVDRLSITLEPRLGLAVRKAAAQSGKSISAWMSAAAADRVRNDLLGEALDAWEAEDGPFTEAELEAGRRMLEGRPPSKRAPA